MFKRRVVVIGLGMLFFVGNIVEFIWKVLFVG